MAATDQIRQMVNFILQEAHEKANEIRVKVCSMGFYGSAKDGKIEYWSRFQQSTQIFPLIEIVCPFWASRLVCRCFFLDCFTLSKVLDPPWLTMLISTVEDAKI